MDLSSLIELTFIKGLGNITINRILENHSPEEVLNLSYEELENQYGKKVAGAITSRDSSLSLKAKEQLEKADRLGIKIIPLQSEDYPSILKEIPDSPPVLYVKGKLPVEERSISIVGTRKLSPYGKFITEKFASELSDENICIVSGLAEGADTIAHKVSVEKGNYTVAVLGCGVDIIFPPSNKQLFHRILENGCVISEFPIGTKPSKYTFPQRNRIIAGLSYGTIITEAPEKSGALITAKYANDYGRVVFAVPSNINNSNGKGTNNLLKEGAFPLTDISDIFTQIPFLKNSYNTEPVGNIELNELEKKILSVLVEPVHIDIIVEKTGLDISEASIVLFDMEMKGVIKGENGVYIRLI